MYVVSIQINVAAKTTVTFVTLVVKKESCVYLFCLFTLYLVFQVLFTTFCFIYFETKTYEVLDCQQHKRKENFQS